MPSNKAGDYELDYVYMPFVGENTNSQVASDSKSMEFKNIHISLRVTDYKINLYLSADEMIVEKDLTDILKNLETTTFKRMHLKIFSDCDVFFIANNQTFQIEMDANTQTITGLKPA